MESDLTLAVHIGSPAAGGVKRRRIYVACPVNVWRGSVSSSGGGGSGAECCWRWRNKNGKCVIISSGCVLIRRRRHHGGHWRRGGGGGERGRRLGEGWGREGGLEGGGGKEAGAWYTCVGGRPEKNISKIHCTCINGEMDR